MTERQRRALAAMLASESGFAGIPAAPKAPLPQIRQQPPFLLTVVGDEVLGAYRPRLQVHDGTPFAQPPRQRASLSPCARPFALTPGEAAAVPPEREER